MEQPAAPSDRHVTESLARLEHRVAEMSRQPPTPAWRRVTDAEHRLPVSLAVLVVIALQTRVPERLTGVWWWVLPVVELVLLAVLVAANPGRIDGSTRRLRVLGLALVSVASLANALAAAHLVVGLVQGTEGKDATGLLVTGGNIWLTNIVVAAIWYWELDRGGPADRAAGVQDRPDFLFPQMTVPDLAGDWEPRFADYLYLGFTNATAFSPTDTLPLSRWSKMAMMLQSAVSLATGALIVARAVNILG